VPTGPAVIIRATELNEDDRKDLERKFSASVGGLRKAFTRGGLVLPTDDGILAVLLKKFNHEKVEALKRAIRVPGLLALPGDQTFAASVALLNANEKRGHKLDVEVYRGRRAVFEEQDRRVIARGGTPELKFGFGEMIPEPLNRKGKLKNIITEWLEDPLAKISVAANQDMYAQLQAQASVLLDRALTGWTMLGRKDEPGEITGEDCLVSGVYAVLLQDERHGYMSSSWWDEYQVIFDEHYPENVDYFVHVRPVVMG
jgi:hypothetical protein